MRMQNSKLFYHFAFKPIKLTEERKKLEKQFKDIDKDIALTRSATQLPKLLERIRVTAFDKLIELAATMTKMDIRLLIYEYPYPKEKAETRRKINKILSTRYTSLVGRTAWELFQHDISDVFLQELIRDSFKRESDSFIGIKEEFIPFFDKAMKNSSGIIDGFIPFLVKRKTKSELLFKECKIKKDSILEHSMLKKMFLGGLQEDFIINRDGEEFVSKSLEKFSKDEYKLILKVYLEARGFEEFHPSILHDATKFRLGDPREQEEEWDFLSEKALIQVKRWVIQKNLIEIFASDSDNNRFNYWKRFIKYMDDVELIKNPKVAFIYFKDFVVVEFGNIGAAYFYHKNGFERFIAPVKNSRQFRISRSNSAKEDMLKERVPEKNGTPLFINKLDHRGQIWKRRFDEQMQKYLNSVKE
ncbi:hypothetical protein M3189_09150 [Neobacillus niacini]|nr:hypothetical protein [Neobacillus niacini]